MIKTKLFVGVLLAGTLLVIAGCRRIHSGGGSKAGNVHDIEIKNCKATIDPQNVSQGDGVRWQPSDDDYTITFADPAEPTGNPFKVNHGQSNSKHWIKGNKGCANAAGGGYDCKYNITRHNEPKPCADPIIHIVPNP